MDDREVSLYIEGEKATLIIDGYGGTQDVVLIKLEGNTETHISNEQARRVRDYLSKIIDQ